MEGLGENWQVLDAAGGIAKTCIGCMKIQRWSDSKHHHHLLCRGLGEKCPDEAGSGEVVWEEYYSAG